MAISRALQNPAQPANDAPEMAALLKLIQRWERRRRLTDTARWLPRGAIGGLVIALLLTILARLTPWLLPAQLEVTTGALALVGMALVGIAVWAWPQPIVQSARRFDQRFGLRERVSTALETSQTVGFSSESMQTLQRRDALDHAQKIRAQEWMPIRWQWREVAAVGVLAAACALMIGLPNPQIAVVAQNNAVHAAVTQAIQQLTQVKQTIQANSTLTDAQKAALSKIADDAIKQLSQPNITQPEAVAALTQASTAFANNQAQLSDAQRQADQQAGQALTQGTANAAQSGSSTSSAQAGLQALGGAMQQGNMTQASTDAQALAQQVQSGQVTGQQAQDTAAALNAAAQALKNSDPAVSNDLQNAATALKNGDTVTASKALKQASADLQADQNNLAQASVSKAAQQAAQQAAQGQQQVAQASSSSPDQSQSPTNPGTTNPAQNSQNQPGNPSAANPSQSGQNSPSQNNSANAASNGASQSSQNGASGASSPDQSGQSGASSQSGQPQAGASSSSGQSAPGKTGGAQMDGGAQGSGDGSGVSVPGQTGNGNGQASSQASGSSAGAGQGAGGNGNPITNGQGSASAPNGPMPTNNGHGDGSVVTNEHVYAPTFVGGSGGPSIDPSNGANNGSIPSQPGSYTNPDTGTSKVPLDNVSAAAQAQADSAMDTDHVPIGLRGVIHDYFSGLQPATSP